MTGGIYRSKIEAMKTPNVMPRRVSYMSNGETRGQQKKRKHESLLEKTNFWQNVLERLVQGFLTFIFSFTPWKISKVKFTLRLFFIFSLLQMAIAVGKSVNFSLTKFTSKKG